jgi:hypothetical protein
VLVAWNIACYLASVVLFKSLRSPGFYLSHAQRLLMRQSSPNESDEWGLVSRKVQRNSVSEARNNIEPAHTRAGAQ